MPGDSRTNIIGDVFGKDINITQIYGPEAMALEPQSFVRSETVRPFSTEWLLFSQQSVPFVGQVEELGEVRRFLDDPAPFSWWAVTGRAGTGKSRLALEILQHLPEGWEGGFIPRHSVNVRCAASWRAKRSTLWIVDDAATSPDLGQIISAWAASHRDAPFKLRLILLERGFSTTSGWWVELTRALSPYLSIINSTLYSLPMTLGPIRHQSKIFLDLIGNQIDEESSQKLSRSLQNFSEDAIRRITEDGNPLLLTFLAFELIGLENLKQSSISLDAGGMVERYFARELDMLKARCDAAHLRFGVMLDLIFLTTSCFPLRMLFDDDRICVFSSDEHLLLTVNDDGLYEIPNLATLRSMGVDLSHMNQPILNDLNQALEIDDVEAYLSVLDEGDLADYRYALHPDLVAEVLLNLIFNSPEVSPNLKRRRGEFERKRFMQLIEYAIKISNLSALSVWARLSNSTLAILIKFLRERGQSIGWTMWVIRQLNKGRSTKIQFDINVLFAPNDVHTNAPEVGRYFSAARNAIALEAIDGAAIEHLANSPHSWSLPYLESLLELSESEKIKLGSIICSITDETILNRLTYLADFLFFLNRTLTEAISHRREVWPSRVESHALANLVKVFFSFVVSRAWPTIATVRDHSFREIYIALARGVITASYAVANNLLGREESPISRQQALACLEIARAAMDTTPDISDLQYIDRNATILQARDVMSISDLVQLFRTNLTAMAVYANSEGFTGAIQDMVHVSAARGAPEMLEALLVLLSDTPPDLVRCEDFIKQVVVVLQSLIAASDPDKVTIASRLTAPFCSFFAARLRGSADVEAADQIRQLAFLAVNWAKKSKNKRDLSSLFVDLRKTITEQQCNPLFSSTVIIAAQTAHIILNSGRNKKTSRFGFETTFIVLSRKKLRTFVRTNDELDKLKYFKNLTIALTGHVAFDGERYVNVACLVELTTFPDEQDAELCSALAQALGARFLASYDSRFLAPKAGRDKITDLKAQRSD